MSKKPQPVFNLELSSSDSGDNSLLLSKEISSLKSKLRHYFD
jgi:hypothetical protein